MKTMIIYASKTGHTKKIAEHMAKSIGVTAQSIQEKPHIEDVDMLFIGSGIYGGKVDPDLEAFVSTIRSYSVKKVALFVSNTPGNTPMPSIREILQSKGIKVIDEEFICKGQFLLFSRKHPDNLDLESASLFAQKVIK